MIKTRLYGLSFALGGLAMTVWQYTSLLNEAKSGVRELHLSAKVFILFVTVFMLGIIMIVRGDKLKKYSQELRGRPLSYMDFILFTFLFLPGILVYFFIQHQLTVLGYDF